MAENDIWTIKAALDWTVGYLERKGDETPLISAQWLLAEACSMRRIDLYTHFEQPLSLEEREVLRGYVARRGLGEPLQYITGEVSFRHIAVKVRTGVLIPRPETEVLVSEGLALLPAAPRPRAVSDGEATVGAVVSLDDAVWGKGVIPGPEDNNTVENQTVIQVESSSLAVGGAMLCKEGESARNGDVGKEGPLVADLCTGSGCIACSLAYEHPLARVVATDLSSEAVSLAGENIVSLGLEDRVRVVECDLGEGIDVELLGSFDLIISNPPYVPTAVLDSIPREVADFEPALALDGGTDGLDIFRRLLSFCSRALKPDGALAFELHETCLDEAVRLAVAAGFVDAHAVDDLARRPRVLVARRAC